MSKLAEISLHRAGLPSFPGATLPEQLLNGRNAALAVLQKYIPDLKFSYSEAKQAAREVDIWETRNETTLEELMLKTGAESLPEAVQFQFGSDKARAFVLYGYTEAARGLGPWLSGAVALEAAGGNKLNARWAEEDGAARLAVFASIVKLEQDGYLKAIFVPPSTGLGFIQIGAVAGATLVWALVVVAVAVAAIIVGYLYLSKTVEINNRLLSDLCKDAQLKGDQKTLDMCVETAAGLQEVPNISRNIAIAVVVLGAIYIAATQGPKWLAVKHRKSEPIDVIDADSRGLAIR